MRCFNVGIFENKLSESSSETDTISRQGDRNKYRWVRWRGAGSKV